MHFGVGAWNTAWQDRARGRTAGLWDSPFPAIPPFLSVLSVCMCLRARVCVYIIIYICSFVCWKIVEAGRELAPEPGFPFVFNCPTAELLQTDDFGEERRRGESVQPVCKARIPVASVLVLSITPVTSKQETAVWEPVAARRNGNLFPKRALSLSVLRVGLVILAA